MSSISPFTHLSRFSNDYSYFWLYYVNFWIDVDTSLFMALSFIRCLKHIFHHSLSPCQSISWPRCAYCIKTYPYSVYPGVSHVYIDNVGDHKTLRLGLEHGSCLITLSPVVLCICYTYRSSLMIYEVVAMLCCILFKTKTCLQLKCGHVYRSIFGIKTPLMGFIKIFFGVLKFIVSRFIFSYFFLKYYWMTVENQCSHRFIVLSQNMRLFYFCMFFQWSFFSISCSLTPAALTLCPHWTR